ncbi:MAG: carboxypeptidase-like regulatory domain-containing protein [Prevotellaceae bacterium]|jgi:hypothetical protein|nr:carboxypeptidase-like regulatory domain-containing protein [Prevotellaceae bacterium]
MKRFLIIRWIWLAAGIGVPGQAAAGEQQGVSVGDSLTYTTIQGTVRDAATRKPLTYVSIYIEDAEVASVSNAEGFFVLKIPASIARATIVFSHLSYKKERIPVTETNRAEIWTVALEPIAYPLKDVVVRPHGDATALVLQALERIPDNYGRQPVAMVAFYRELVKRNNSYVSVAEAVLDIRKAPYASRQTDAARIYRGRKSANVHRSDTVLFKYQGGIVTTLLLDAAKNTDLLFTAAPHENYTFTFNEMVMIDEKPHYAISFNQRPATRDILFRGTIYLEPLSLGIARIEFNMNVEDRPESAQIFVKRSPRGAKVTPVYATYVVNFREQDGRWRYAYSRSEVKFKSNFKRFFFFRPTCTVISELAITDADETNTIRIPRKEAVSIHDIVADELTVFTGDAFWGAYNYIEPEQPIENAIRKMNRQLKRAGIQ